ncbi:hypothetical protein [Chitiniphilus eburneus]|uniref:YqjK-like protein n=1 Tax=Chitiniphilus eburneus TaxID=2571148 RepID=A0A4U0QEF2_9NEIS|nr:hypothetical protein [Chitiniphilus eburneus]TJZ79032.1 hypothetical protein FAZ21_01735 [Chitiniphilus eburneus]
MSQAARSNREARKRLLQLEAELHRVELSASLYDIRAPFRRGGRDGFLGLFQPAKLLTLVAGLVAGNKLNLLSRLIPIGIGAWKAATLIRQFFARRRAARAAGA